jgi:hypothetical protein
VLPYRVVKGGQQDAVRGVQVHNLLRDTALKGLVPCQEQLVDLQQAGQCFVLGRQQAHCILDFDKAKLARSDPSHTFLCKVVFCLQGNRFMYEGPTTASYSNHHLMQLLGRRSSSKDLHEQAADQIQIVHTHRHSQSNKMQCSSAAACTE